MRFPARSKLGVILSLVTILTVVSGFMVMAIASRGSGAHAASSAGVSYKTAHGQLAANPLQLGGQNPAPATSTTVYAAPDHFGTPNAAAQNAPAAAGLSVLKGSATTALESHIDMIVYNATSGAAKEYKIDDTFPAHPGCPCLGDQEKIGVDNNAVYLSVDEFEDWAAGGTIEDGADVFIISKPQLVSQVTANFTAFANLAIGGIPVTSLQPAISTSATNTEFLANSFPFLADGENNPVAATLGFWKVTGDSNVTSG